MNIRKQNVLKKAHELFINKGFQATSIQDILDYSGISKGTFYNYFSSKNELLMDIIKLNYKELEEEQNKFLIGQDPTDIQIFIKQVEYQMMMNRRNKLIPLFDEVMVSDDAELKEFIKRGQIRSIRWLYFRFIDIFGENKKEYLLDCAIMFIGILHQNLKYSYLTQESEPIIHRVIQYSVNRIIHIVENVSKSGERLIDSTLIESWLADCKEHGQTYRENVLQVMLDLKRGLFHEQDQAKYTELLDFIQEELLNQASPRKFLVESALHTLQANTELFHQKDLDRLEELIDYRT